MNSLVMLAALLGLVLGSMLNVLVVRIPREEGLGGAPRCTGCGQPLAFWQLLPLVGWLTQGGKARCCGKQLHWIFPVVEAAMAVALGMFAWRYGFGIVFWYLTFVSAVLVLTAAIDWLHRYIYTFFILTPALVALVMAMFVPGHSFRNALLGLLIGGIAFTLLFMLGRILFASVSVPFGLGDVYLALFIGAAVGIVNLMPALFIGMLLAGAYSAYILIMRKLGSTNQPQYISYGSFLCVGVLIYLTLGMGTF